MEPRKNARVGAIESLESRTLLAYAAQVVGYYSNHSSANLAKVDLSALTQLNYFGVTANADGTLVSSSFTPSTLTATVTAAHAKNVKVNITVTPDAPFTTIMASSTAINTFTTALVNLCSTYHLDGIDLDWEAFPPTTTQVNQYGAMLTTMHAATQSAGLTLSAAVEAANFNVPKTALGSLDWFNLMDYDLDYNSSAPLSESQTYLNNWASYGVPKSKLLMGVPFYGRAGTSWSDTQTKLYSTIVSNYQTQYGTILDPSLDSVTLSGTTWGFNGVNTIRTKANYVVSNGYGGMMIWELTEDHWNSTPQYDTMSLLPTIKNILQPLAWQSGSVVTVNPLAGGVTIVQSGGTLRIGSISNIYSFPSASVSKLIFSGSSGADALTIGAGVTQSLDYIGNGGADSLTIAGNFSSNTNLSADAPNLSVSVNQSITLSLSGTQTLSSLTCAGTVSLVSGGNSVLNVGSLNITPSGKLDLTNNNLIWNYSGSTPAATLANELKNGQIFSSVLAATANCTLGWAESSTLFGSAGGTFAGQTVDSTTLLARFTYLGDANLDRSVNIADLGLLASNYGSTAATYTMGDFNGDGKVDIADLGLLASDYGKTLTF